MSSGCVQGVFWHNRFCPLGEDLPSRLSTKVFCLISSNFLHYDYY
jgi:hypothetical protein